MLTFQSLCEQIVETGRPCEAGAKGIAVFSIIRNEIYFLPAFFDHYRKLGASRFLILDDGSSDGSREFLESQPDCIVLSAPYGFGDRITVQLPEGTTVTDRAGTLLKRAIPTRYLMGEYAVYADADEFLVLPPSLPSLPHLIGELRRSNSEAVAASLVDFYPPSVSDLDRSSTPRHMDDLLEDAGWFDAAPLVQVKEEHQVLAAGESASARLFRKHGITEPLPLTEWMPDWLQGMLPGRTPRAAWYKTPVIHWTAKTWMVGSHNANVPPSPSLLLAMAHFKFTPDFRRRVEAARIRKSHARKGQKYDAYSRLLQRMTAANAVFKGEHSVRFRAAQNFLDCGLMFDHLSGTDEKLVKSNG